MTLSVLQRVRRTNRVERTKARRFSVTSASLPSPILISRSIRGQSVRASSPVPDKMIHESRKKPIQLCIGKLVVPIANSTAKPPSPPSKWISLTGGAKSVPLNSSRTYRLVPRKLLTHFTYQQSNFDRYVAGRGDLTLVAAQNVLTSYYRVGA